MNKQQQYTLRISLIVALGGFLMGFDASVISGVVKFIEPEFDLTKLELGWAVGSLTLTATLAMMLAGPLADRFGRKSVLKFAALFYAISAIGSAFAPDYVTLVIARMTGGFGVGASLITAPMYIAEISPPNIRGRMVSFNQLNVVIGISVAFFTNYLILQLSQLDDAWIQFLSIDRFEWRWMLGLETLPAAFYFILLFAVPESPRWLIMKGEEDRAFGILKRVSSSAQAHTDINAVKVSILEDTKKKKVPLHELFKPALRLALTIGIVLAILQQITGINSVFFYAPMIFEQAGLGLDASFAQAIYVGLTNLVFTIVALSLIDKIGRKLLLIIGVSGMAISMFVLTYGFNAATYSIDDENIAAISTEIDGNELNELRNIVFTNDVVFKNALNESLGEKASEQFNSKILAKAIKLNSTLILLAILTFVASFAVSIGPVMWVMFSELFPNSVRAVAVSFVGFINSLISFSVQLVFPWELAHLGTTLTFFIYGLFAAAGLVFILIKVPETKGKTLEELQVVFMKKKKRSTIIYSCAVPCLPNRQASDLKNYKK